MKIEDSIRMCAFSMNLRRLADKKDVTQREVAKKIYVTDIRAKKLFSGMVWPTPVETVNILIYFDCKPSELFGTGEKQ